jgi:hypothetical protein
VPTRNQGNPKKEILTIKVVLLAINNIKRRKYETRKYSDRASTLMDAFTHRNKIEDQVAYVDNLSKIKKEGHC